MVRLKGPKSLSRSKSFSLFQFHMVRLKGPKSLSRSKSFSLFQFHMVRLKDSTKTLRKEQLIKFQFHMVRLKVHQLHDVRLHELISIPHGTIKSIFGFGAELHYLRFQFHMVRLKVFMRPIRVFPRAYFNSTWYD